MRPPLVDIGTCLRCTLAPKIDVWPYPTARALADELSGLAERLGDAAYSLQAHHAQWSTRLYLGEFAECREHAEQGIAVYDARKHHAQTFRFGGHDPCVCGYGIAAISLCVLGYPDQAVAHVGDAVDLGHRIQHPQSLVLALELGAREIASFPTPTMKGPNTGFFVSGLLTPASFQ